MHKYLFLLFIFCLAGCQPERQTVNPFTFAKQPQTAFASLINQGKLTTEPKVTLVNHEYPISLALFEDGRFRYTLENLGDGEGTWTHQDGAIRLQAERKLFVMKINLHSLADAEGAFAIDFVDRFGTNYLLVDKL